MAREAQTGGHVLHGVHIRGHMLHQEKDVPIQIPTPRGAWEQQPACCAPCLDGLCVCVLQPK
eukprot:1161187-Pelagomonas_calceolata.AAC.8